MTPPDLTSPGPEWFGPRETGGLAMSGVRVMASAQAPLTSLSGASATGPGYVLDNCICAPNHSIVVTSGAGVSAGAVQLQGSLDGVNWFNMGAAVSTTTANTVFAPVAVTGQPVRFLRANITTAITGGTVSASIASA